MKDTKTKLMIVMCAVVALMAVGYAAFSTVLTINGTANIASEWKVVFTNITQESITSGVTIKTEPQASGTTATFDVGLASPGDKIVYKITLSNQGTLDAIVKDIQASATDSPAIIFSVTGIDVGYELNQQTSKDFYVTIEYDPNITTQPEKLQKTLTVNIITEQKLNQSVTPGTPIVDQPLYLSASILRDNAAYADNVASPNVTSSTGINFSSPSISTVYEEKHSDSEGDLAFNGPYYFGTTYSYDASTGSYTVGGTTTQAEWSSMSSDYSNYQYACFAYQQYCREMYVITGYTDSATGTGYVYTSELKTALNNGQGLYYTSTNTEDNKTTYYFRGDVNNNYVKFGKDSSGNDILWRIVRINEDGSVRLVTQNSVGTSVFNGNDNDNAYVGYMFGTPNSGEYGATHMNTNNSTIKNYLDDWYVNKSNLSNYTYLMSTEAGFCNDRSLMPGYTEAGYGKEFTYYGSSGFVCTQTDDLFTLNTANKGNKKLTNPVGLLTGEELKYAGIVSNENGSFSETNQNYLNINSAFWTMTPMTFQGSSVVFEGVNNDGYIANTYASQSVGVRPVINLKGAVELSTELPSGCTRLAGTEACPYIIKTN